MEPNEKEELVVVLDFLPNGYPFDNRPSFRKTPIAQVMSKKFFTLLEIIPKKDVTIQAMEELYIGELEFVIEKLVKENPQRFLDFFNKCGPISTRMHQIELLPGIGKKHMWVIIETRQEKPFESFEDIKSRISAIPDPLKIVVRRILMELNNEDKYKIFVR